MLVNFHFFLLLLLVKQFVFDIDGSTATKAAFYEQKYIDRHGVLRAFFDHINDSLNEWDTVKYHSPLVALMQASTIGKSKMLWAAAEHVYVLYGLCMPSQQKIIWYPSSINYFR